MKYNQYDIEDFLKDRDFIDWVKGRCSEKDLFFENWLNTNPVNKKKAILAREILVSLYPVKLDPLKGDYEEVLEKVLKYKGTQKIPGTRITRTTNLVWRWAAIILIVFTFAYILHDTWEKKPVLPQSAEIHKITKQNPPGQRSQIHLPDGSVVHLNAESRITYISNFGKNSRDITLTGEAFFTVKKNDQVPFKVKTGNIYTQAIGTSFNISAWQEDEVAVALVSGKAEVGSLIKDEKSTNILNPGQKLIHKQNEFIRTNYTNEEIAWKDGVIIFNKASIIKVKETLQRWYGVTIRLENLPEGRWSYTGRFVNTSLEIVLERMSYTERFNYEIINDFVTIKFL